MTPTKPPKRRRTTPPNFDILAHRPEDLADFDSINGTPTSNLRPHASRMNGPFLQSTFPSANPPLSSRLSRPSRAPMSLVFSQSFDRATEQTLKITRKIASYIPVSMFSSPAPPPPDRRVQPPLPSISTPTSPIPCVPVRAQIPSCRMTSAERMRMYNSQNLARIRGDPSQSRQFEKAFTQLKRFKSASRSYVANSPVVVDLTVDDDAHAKHDVDPEPDEMVSESDDDILPIFPSPPAPPAPPAFQIIAATPTGQRSQEVIDVSSDDDVSRASRLKSRPQKKKDKKASTLVSIPIGAFSSGGPSVAPSQPRKKGPKFSVRSDEAIPRQRKQTTLHDIPPKGPPRRTAPTSPIGRAYSDSFDDILDVKRKLPHPPNDTCGSQKLEPCPPSSPPPFDPNDVDDLSSPQGASISNAKNVLANYRKEAPRQRGAAKRTGLPQVPIVLNPKRSVQPPPKAPPIPSIQKADDSVISLGSTDEGGSRRLLEVPEAEDLAFQYAVEESLADAEMRERIEGAQKRVEAVDNIRLRELTVAEKQRVQRLTRGVVMKRQIIVRIPEANIILRGEDISCLRGQRWLNDEIMNSFVALVNARNREHVRKRVPHEPQEGCLFGRNRLLEYVESVDEEAIFEEPRPRTHVFNTFFYTRLTQGDGNEYDYGGVQRWLKRAGHKVEDLDLILIPVNLTNFHWVLAGIDLRNRAFLYLDSMLEEDSARVVKSLKRWLRDEVTDKVDKETADRMDIELWREVVNPDYVPRQTDGGSCGVFTLYMAEYLERGVRPDFAQKDIAVMRYRTALALCDRQLAE